MISSILILVITISSCNIGKVKESAMSYTENENLIKQYFEHFNNHEW